MSCQPLPVRALLLLLLLTTGVERAAAQYFGKNKAQYETFDFEVLETPHLSVYHYMPDTSAILFGRQAERWYSHHQRFFKDTIDQRNPLVLYNNHADFQQTAIVSSNLSPATSGVTEGLKNRVVMPMLFSRKETHHVLGHELVHAFQYHLAKEHDSLSVRRMSRQPLWLIEGMAEYLSLGRHDPHTAMWMRDAVLHDDVPSLQEMTRQPGRYFPYRYGHAFWAFLTGITELGDDLVRPFFVTSGQYGYRRALDTLLRIGPDSLSGLWEKALQQQYRPLMEDTTAPVGDTLAGPAQGGDNNLSPVVSPDGKKVVFLSDKSAIDINLYLARTETGRVVKKLSRELQLRSDIDDYSFARSAGTWSPNSRFFAFTTYQEGETRLVVVNAQNGKVDREIVLEGVPSFAHPAWSPDGERIAVSGLRHGQSDLYVHELASGETRQLTHDPRSALQPAWSPDGQRLVYARERSDSADLRQADWEAYEMVVYDTRTGRRNVLEILPGANNLNPQFGPEGRSIYFLSDAHGFRDLYEIELETGRLYRRTHFFTGISGFSTLSPAFSVARANGQVVYSLYRRRRYTVMQAPLDSFPREEMAPGAVDRRPALLPPFQVQSPERLVETPQEEPLPSPLAFEEKAYQGGFGLSRLGPFGAGVATGPFGTGVQGGISGYFTDMLNYHQLFASVRVSGRLVDAAAQATYINRKQQLNWGASLSHIPYRRFFYGFDLDTSTLDGVPVAQEQFIREELRIFQEQAGLFTRYPFSRHLRVEAGLNLGYYHFRLDSVTQVFANGAFVEQTREQIDAPYESYFQAQGYGALVGDQSEFGLTGPLLGRRFRLEASRWFLEDNYTQLLADYRRYFYPRPYALAFRGMFVGRYGRGADQVSPFFIGSDYFVRGYQPNFNQQQARDRRDDALLNELIGSRMAVANAEVRLPFTGPEELAVIPSQTLFTTLFGFADAGAAWGRTLTTFAPFAGEQTGAPSTFSEVDPIVSSGLGLRVNAFGAIVLEGYAAAPFQRQGKGLQFGFLLTNGGF
jgi:hypothetical protein